MLVKLALTAAILLSSVACPLVQADSRLYALIKKPNPVAVLDSYLIQGTNSLDFNENAALLNQVADSEAFKANTGVNDKVRELAKLVGKLATGDICSQANLATLLESIEKVSNSDKHELSDSRQPVHRLGALLVGQVDEAHRICVPKFESQWTANGGSIEKSFSDEFGVKLSVLDPYNRVHASLRNDAPTTGLIEFSGSLRREEPNRIGSNTGIELKATLMDIHEALTKESGLKLDPSSGKSTPEVTVDEAAKLLDEYLLGPCTRLANRPETLEILKPVVDLGKLILMESSSKLIEGKFSVFKWAARYMECTWLLSLDRIKMAKLVSKTHIRRV